ncbi:MAG: dephospho-CoA kinase [Acidimicrobiales bacterium]|nr:dephospho-CoA kinase [Actinomycetota bacterium]
MYVVGLTGGIGSGKSTVSAMLARRGAAVVDTDVIARQVVEPPTPAYAAIVDRFGPGVVVAGGGLDRRALADLVFDDPQALADLNAIVHPAVRAEVAERLAAEQAGDSVVVLVVPLLVETGMPYDVGVVIVVDCPEDVAVRRLVDARGMDEADVRRRLAAQASREERRARADLVIDNAGSLAELEAQVERAWAWLNSPSPNR